MPHFIACSFTISGQNGFLSGKGKVAQAFSMI